MDKMKADAEKIAQKLKEAKKILKDAERRLRQLLDRVSK
jgi:hypothetical protein